MNAITKTSDLMSAFKERGWRTSFDEVGDAVAMYRIETRILVALPQVRPYRAYLGGYVTNDAMSVAKTTIQYPKKRIAEDVPLVKSPAFWISESALDEAAVDAAIAEWIDWGSTVDIDASITALLDKKANGRGAMPMRHLAALAVTGKVEVLESYDGAFSTGDRLGFVPYIKAAHVSAAHLFARRRKDDPDWLPSSPRLRV